METAKKPNQSTEPDSSPSKTAHVSVVAADQLHAEGITGAGVTLAVLDSGLSFYDPIKRGTDDEVKLLAQYDATKVEETEIAFKPARVVLQDLTGVPAVVDLAAMRAAIVRMTGHPSNSGKVNPMVPCDLIIDHSVQVDFFATPEALQKGVVKGLYSSLEVMKDFKFAETCKYVTITDTVIYPFAVVMNMDSWNKLPEDVQQVMDDLRVEQSEWTGTYMDNHVKAAMEWAKTEQNVEVITLSAEEKAKWDAKLISITNKWIEDASANGLPGDKIVEDIKILKKKYSK